ncbi:hypothetical protein [Natrinema versiforme]|nr:hypothetical protein [Natrinema versiforme]
MSEVALVPLQAVSEETMPYYDAGIAVPLRISIVRRERRSVAGNLF